ncbi:hypothetical protein HDU96_004307 [Phlyctochytrium bullatum]|nr:hypothetical protein HDU96_004307 [Phlyctochytrium bullatum]
MAPSSRTLSGTTQLAELIVSSAGLAAALALALPPTRCRLRRWRDKLLSDLGLTTTADETGSPPRGGVWGAMRAALVCLGWAHPPLESMAGRNGAGWEALPAEDDAGINDHEEQATSAASGHGAQGGPMADSAQPPVLPWSWFILLVLCAGLQVGLATALGYFNVASGNIDAMTVAIEGVGFALWALVLLLLLIPNRTPRSSFPCIDDSAADPAHDPEHVDVAAFTLASILSLILALLRAATVSAPALSTFESSWRSALTWGYLTDPFGARLMLAGVCVLAAGCGVSAVRAGREDREDEDFRKRWGPRRPVPCRENGASLFSRMYFSWLSPLIRLGRAKSLAMEDIPDLPPQNKSSKVIPLFQALRSRSRVNHLGLQLLYFELPTFLLQILFSLLSTLCNLSSPYLVYRITDHIQSGPGSNWVAVWYAALLGSTMAMKAVFDGQVYHEGRHVGVRIRAVLVDAIYVKGLRRVAATPKSGEGSHGARQGIKKTAPLETDEEDDGVKRPNPAAKPVPVEEPAKSKEPEETEDSTSVGKIVTLMSTDTEKIREAGCYLFYLLTAPLQIFASILGLIYLLGWAAAASLAIMLLTLPVTFILARWVHGIMQRLMAATDRRTEIVHEALQGIRIIKLFAWEPQFRARIAAARAAELRELAKAFAQFACSFLLFKGTPLLVSFGTFAAYTWGLGGKLDARTAFASISLLNTLRVPLFALPEITSVFFQVLVALERIQTFLDGPELEKYKADANTDTRATDEVHDAATAAGFIRASFAWHVAEDPKAKPSSPADETTPLLQSGTDVPRTEAGRTALALQDITVTFPAGQLTCIIGATGSGKSSLLQALLGELNRVSGTSWLPSMPVGASDEGDWKLTAGVAYVAQTSWLMNATIRDNICFGEPYEAERYTRVVWACALVKDFEGFEAGDLTEIGEKGINMSGGQKQRISLARACYSRASLILLDDPLSAVDAPTARHLFVHAILGLLSTRTRVLVTHAVALTLPAADRVVVMRAGRVAASGAVAPTMRSAAAADALGAEVVAAVTAALESGSPSTSPSTASPGSAFPVLRDFANGKTRADARKLVGTEEQQTGAVKLAVHGTYLVAAGGVAFLGVFWAALAAEKGMQATDTFWIRRWVEAYGTGDGEVDTWYFVGVYGLIVSGWMMCNVGAYGCRCVGSYLASMRLHDRLMEKIFRAPIRFFDRTPIVSGCLLRHRFKNVLTQGRILNRASKDIAAIDQEVMVTYHNTFALLMELMAVTMIVTYITPVFFLAFLPYILVYYGIASDYLASSRELKRLDSVTRSPIYSMFSESLVGASTIRAYASEPRFQHTTRRLTDANHRAYFLLWTSNRWLGVRVSTVAGFIVITSAVITVLSAERIGAGLAGISLIWSLGVSEQLIWLIRYHAMMEMGLNSVERVEEYVGGVEQEREDIVEGLRPPAEWPTCGAVSIKDLVLSYAPDLEPVLKGVSVEIPGGCKLGVVGRTGAGKSTLTLALFRLVEALSGTIRIDGLDISRMGLRDLRSRLTIIPQDPVLFAGTVRTNMDPFGDHPDAAILSCLQRVRLVEPEGGAGFLDEAVVEGGRNFSQGQRQLLCLARALLRRSKVAVLDEATASVDNETDARIQETIRGEEFREVTVVSIAHRLRTVADCDLVLVLDQGRVAQFGPPRELMADRTGLFWVMCEESGEAAELEEIALKRWS